MIWHSVDNDGTKWIDACGCDAGLIEFDGVNWVTYDTLNSRLTSNFIYPIATSNEKAVLKRKIYAEF